MRRLTALEARSPRPRGQQGWLLLRPPSLAQRRLSSHGFPSVYVWVLNSSCKTQVILGLTASSCLNYLFKYPSPNTVTFWGVHIIQPTTDSKEVETKMGLVKRCFSLSSVPIICTPPLLAVSSVDEQRFTMSPRVAVISWFEEPLWGLLCDLRVLCRNSWDSQREPPADFPFLFPLAKLYFLSGYCACTWPSTAAFSRGLYHFTWKHSIFTNFSSAF